MAKVNRDMPTSALPQSSAVRQSVEALLAHRIPGALTPAPRVLRPTVPTGVPVLDALLRGGVPAGALSEIVGPISSGRTTLAIRLVAEALRTGGSVAAWVDVSGTLDAEGAAANGVALDRLLWVRCGARRGERTVFQTTRAAVSSGLEQTAGMVAREIARPYPNALRSDAPSGKMRRGVPAAVGTGADSGVWADGTSADGGDSGAASLLGSSSEALLQVVPRAGATLPSGGCGSPHPRGEVRGLDTAIATLFASPRMGGGMRTKPGTPSAPNLLLGEVGGASAVSQSERARYEPAKKVAEEGLPVDGHARMWSAPHRSHQKVQPAIERDVDSPFAATAEFPALPRKAEIAPAVDAGSAVHGEVRALGPAATRADAPVFAAQTAVRTNEVPFFAAKPDCEHKRPTASPFTLRKGGTSSGPKTIAQLIAAKSRMAEERRTGVSGPRQAVPRQAVPQHEQVPSERQPSRRACFHAAHDPLRCPRCGGAEQARAAKQAGAAKQACAAEAKALAKGEGEGEARDAGAKPSPEHRQGKERIIGLHLESNALPTELPANFCFAGAPGVSAGRQFRTAAQAAPMERIDQALRATDLLLQGGGFRVLVLDLGGIGAEYVSRVPLATWFRFRSLAESTQCALVVLLQHDCAKSAAELVLRLQPADLCGRLEAPNAVQPLAKNGRGNDGVRTQAAYEQTVRNRFVCGQAGGDTIFGGLRFTAEVLRRRFQNEGAFAVAQEGERRDAEPRFTTMPATAPTATLTAIEGEPSNVVSMRKPAQLWAGEVRSSGYARRAVWTAQMAWAASDAVHPDATAPAAAGKSDPCMHVERACAMAVPEELPATKGASMAGEPGIVALREPAASGLPYVVGVPIAGTPIADVSIADVSIADVPMDSAPMAMRHAVPARQESALARHVTPRLHAMAEKQQTASAEEPIIASDRENMTERMGKAGFTLRPAAVAAIDGPRQPAPMKYEHRPQAPRRQREGAGQALLHGLEHVATAMHASELGGRTGAGL